MKILGRVNSGQSWQPAAFRSYLDRHFVLFCFCTVPKLGALFISFNGWEKEINRRFCGS